MANRFLISVQENVSEPEWFKNVEPFLEKAMKLFGFDGQEISVLFCNNPYIQELNKMYREIDNPTDVLSFENGEIYEDGGKEWFCAGDIVISIEMISENASYFNTTENAELKRLLVHGLLHLNGMDHGEEHIEPGTEPVCEMLVIQEEKLKLLNEEIIIEK